MATEFDLFGDVDFNLEDFYLPEREGLFEDLSAVNDSNVNFGDEWFLKLATPKQLNTTGNDKEFTKPVETTMFDSIFDSPGHNDWPLTSAEDAHQLAVRSAYDGAVVQPSFKPALGVSSPLKRSINTINENGQRGRAKVARHIMSNWRDVTADVDHCCHIDATVDKSANKTNRGHSHQGLGKKTRMKKECKLEALRDRERLLLKENNIMRDHLEQAGVPCPRSNHVEVTLTDDNPRRDRRRRSKSTLDQKKVNISEVRDKYYSPSTFSIIRVGPTGNFETCFCSPGYLSLLGVASDEVIGSSYNKFFSTKNNREVLNRLQSSIAKGEQLSENVQYIRSDGSLFWNYLVVTPALDENSNVAYCVCVHKPALSGEKPALN